MGKIFKLMNAELKKIFLRPTIFIMVGLIVITSFISLAIFKPQQRNDVEVLIQGASVSQIVASFDSVSGTVDTKAIFNKILEDKKSEVLSYKTPDTSLTTVKDKILEVNVACSALSSNLSYAGLSDSRFREDEAKEQINNYKAKLQELLSVVADKFSKTSRYLIYDSSYEYTMTLIKSEIKILPSNTADTLSVDVYKTLLKNIRSNNFSDKINTAIASFVEIELKSESIDELITKYYDPAIVTLNSIYTDKIFVFKTENGQSGKQEDFEQINAYISEYKSCILMATENLNSALTLLIGSSRSDSKMQAYRDFTDYNQLSLKATLTKNSYLIENGLFARDTLNSLTLGVNSGQTTNAYDFALFASYLISVLVVMFCIIISSKIFAGEQASGTMKLLAIRPYTRNKILTGKLLATIFFALVFLIFGLLINILIGLFVFGMPAASMKMIGVFNGVKILYTSPVIFLILSTLSLFVKVVVFVLLAIMISVMFRAYTGAVIISFVSYLITMILNATLYAKTWFKYFPMANFDLYQYFIPAKASASGFNAMLSAPVLPDASVVFTAIYLVIVMTIFTLASFITFNKRDFA